MSNRSKNICILAILILFLFIVEIIPVTCIFKTVTGISCPACGMTRAFHSIMQLQFYEAFTFNILSIPLFVVIIIAIICLLYEIVTNKYLFIPKLLQCLSNKYVIIAIIILLCLSFLVNNI